MKNKVKYPKTEDALEAYEAFKATSNRAGEFTFYQWLDEEADEKRDESKSVVSIKSYMDQEPAQEPAGFACPFCGSEKTVIETLFGTSVFVCNDCDATIGFCDGSSADDVRARFKNAKGFAKAPEGEPLHALSLA